MSAYCQLTAKDNRILVISFSHMGVPAGSFSHPRTLNDFPYSLLQVNCPNNSFYLSPIPGLGQDVESIASALKSRIAEVRPRKLVCYGASMGAFGALLYGFLLEADLVIALGPQVSLDLKGAPAQFVAKDRTIFSHPLGQDLLKVVKSCKTRVIALFGEKAIADMVGALALHDRLPGSCFSIKNAYHPVASFIEGVYGLNRFLLETVESEPPAAFFAEHCGDLIQHRGLVESLYGIACGSKRDNSFLEILEAIPAWASFETRSYAYLAAAKYFLEKKEELEGRYALCKAFSLNSNDIDLMAFYFEHNPKEFMSLRISKEHLFKMLNLNKWDRYPSFYRLAALMLRHRWPVSPHPEKWLAPFFPHDRHRAELAFHLAQLLEGEGDWQAAEEHLQQAVTLNPTNTAYSQSQMTIRARRKGNEEARIKDPEATKAA